MQIEKKIDVIRADYFEKNEIYVMEQALYKIATPALLADKEISKAIRLMGGRIVEVNPAYSIVSKEGLPEEVRGLYDRLQAKGCVLQYVSSGVIAVTKSRREELAEYLQQRDEACRTEQ